MHILESYALNTATKISDPFIYEDFFPLAVDKYITLDSYSENDSRDYKYWEDVVSYLVPHLVKKGISIVQLCGSNRNEIKQCYTISGNTTQNQNAYIIKNSLLHLGVDNLNSEMASYYDVNQICLIAATHVGTSKPFWGNNKCICLSPERNGNPTYISNENPKTIDKIKPETIVNKIFDFLKIEKPLGFETISMGRLYPQKSFHFICDAPVLSYDLSGIDKETDLKIRLDLGKPETNIFIDFLNRINHNEISVVTNQIFQPEQLLPFKNKIKIIYLIDENHNSQFVSRLRQLGMKYELATKLPQGELEKLKLEYMDLGLIRTNEELNFDNLEESEKENFSNVINYKSSKYIMSKGKFFPSEYALSLNEGEQKWEENKIYESVDIDNRSTISDLFWKDSKYFSILKKTID